MQDGTHCLGHRNLRLILASLSLELWIKAHRRCPMCKIVLSPSALTDITLKPQKLKVLSENVSGASSASSTRDISHIENPSSATTKPGSAARIYADFHPGQLAEIKNIDLVGPNFTTKVDTMVRHLLWLREKDPGAKSIVFSQYREFLDVLGQAFRQHGVGHACFDGVKAKGSRGQSHGTHGHSAEGSAYFAAAQPHGQEGVQAFKQDPGIEVLLLSARAHASGLNLVNASHVFLCEPLLNTALELQAIARVDRIGQQHETTVWLYIAEGTVEESIYKLSVQRRLEHVMSGRVSSTPRRGGGEPDSAGKGKQKHEVDGAPPNGSASGGGAHPAAEEGTQQHEEGQRACAVSAAEEDLDLGNLDAVNTKELQQANLSRLMDKGNAGEMVADEDLWACLFGHARPSSSTT